MQMTLTALSGIPVVRSGDDLAGIILAGAKDIGLLSGDVIVIAQKIVSKAEGQAVKLDEIEPSAEAVDLADQTQKDPRLVEVILSESKEVLRFRPGIIIVEHRLGFVCANAGVDHSNVEGEDVVLMLPEDPDASAGALRAKLAEASGIQLGLLIIDSHGRAWRNGTTGVAIGVSGVPALLDLRGWLDMFGDPLEVTQVGLADELAAAASVLMGQADEGRPIVHIRGLPHELRESSMHELLRPKELDLFR